MPSTPTTPPDLGPIGGQALPEGVMMRRADAWGAAVRRLDGTIATTGHRLGTGSSRWRRLPLLRGVVALADTTVLGTRATLWAASERGDEDGNGFHPAGLAAVVAVAVVAVVGVFGLLPAVLVKLLGITNPVAFSAVEGAIRVAILVGYLALLGRSARIRRIFAFHGAEHMTIHAFEHRAPLEPAAIRTFDRRHPRCGTAFLLIVALTSVVVHAAVGHPSWPVLVASRILGLPIVAGVAYEIIRYAGRHQHSAVGRILQAPGSWLQSITTAEPTDDMIEVAVVALRTTLEVEETGRPAPDRHGAAVDSPAVEVDVDAVAS
jgi:uncharacterized protein YqhQ